jgi:hypothetical protein
LGDTDEYDLTLYEKNTTIFSEISGKFGIRIHTGPHYPRSPVTRKACREGFEKFCLVYPELINELKYSIYAVGKKDVDGNPSKANEQDFRKVCREFHFKNEVDCASYGYDTDEVLAAFNIDEPCAVLGTRLRTIFQRYLILARVTVNCDFNVTTVMKIDKGIVVGNDTEQQLFDHVINATSYQVLLPNKPLPLKVKIVYQICLGLIYEDQTPLEKPISFIVMDGWFPCLMPYDDRQKGEENKPLRKYVVTHGKWTILASYDTVTEAEEKFKSLDDQFIEQHVKQQAELYLTKCWPDFAKRFQYKTWNGAVLAKITTNTEFRGAITLQDESTDVIYVLPGKITNIFDAEQEALSLIKKQNILKVDGFNYVKNGVFAQASDELTQSTKQNNNLTGKLQTFKKELDALAQQENQVNKDNQ